MKKLNKCIGLIGVGYWGKNILRNLCALDVLHTACDSSLEILKQHKGIYPEVHYTDSFKEVLRCKEIKGVVIATPAHTHYRMVKESLSALKDVFVEKPLALTVKEGRELVELAKRKKRILMVGHILQYHPAILKLKELIAKGELGKIRYLYSNRLNIGKLRTEENILWSFAPHDISAILMLTGEEPVKVRAFAGEYLSAGISDVTLTSLEFRNGIKGHIFVSWLHPYKEQKLIVVGSKAMAVFDDVSQEKLFLYPHTIHWKDGKIPIAQKADFKVIPIPPGEPLRLELEHFIDCIKTRKKPKTDGLEGLRVLKILESAESSLSENEKDSKPHNDNDNGVFIHKSAVVDPDVTIGKGTRIWHFSHILRNTRIGKNCVIGQNVMAGPDVIIGSGCKIQNNVSIYKGVILKEDVFCGPSCVFTNVYSPRAFIERKDEFSPTLVKRGATIGANATIVCGTTIGRYSLVGAGAVVKRDVPDHAVVAGVPAKQIGWACICGATLSFIKARARCHRCKRQYSLKKSGIECHE